MGKLDFQTHLCPRLSVDLNDWNLHAGKLLFCCFAQPNNAASNHFSAVWQENWSRVSKHLTWSKHLDIWTHTHWQTHTHQCVTAAFLCHCALLNLEPACESLHCACAAAAERWKSLECWENQSLDCHGGEWSGRLGVWIEMEQQKMNVTWFMSHL